MSNRLTASAVMIVCCLSIAAYAENIVSVPAGFVRVDLPPGQYTPSSLPFVPFNDSVQAVLGAQLTGPATYNVSQWDKQQQVYTIATLVAGAKDGVWTGADGKPSGMAIQPGQGFVIFNGNASTQTVALSGYVVVNDDVTIDLYPGLNLFGFPFSSAVDAKDAGLPGATDGTLQMGAGYWYEQTGAAVTPWVTVRPYANLFPSDAKPPVITALKVDASGSVSLAAAGEAAGQIFDVLIQDVAAPGLKVAAGWKVAAKGLVADKDGNIAWTDDAAGISGRYYLVARGDIDVDGDGLTDAAEVFVHGTNPKLVDSDGDGISDSQELVALIAQNAGGMLNIVIVNAKIGNDKFDGRSAKVAVNKNGTTTGPKASIKSGQKVLQAGGTLMIQSGSYVSEGAHSFGGKGTVVISGDGVVSL